MSILKELARRMFFLAKRKPYKMKVNREVVTFKPIKSDSDKEFFFGYYDKSPENNGRVLFHEMLDGEVNIIVRDIATCQEKIIGKSKAYNWQMGSRAMWLDNDTVSWNDFDGEKYVCKWYSLSRQTVVKIIPMAVMDYAGKDYALGTNWQRLISVNQDYSYDCLPEMSDKDVMKCGDGNLCVEGKHCANHIMANPSGTAFMFIHRYRYEGKRFDRLMYYDFQNLVCLLDDPMQSHFCWLDDHTLMGYSEHHAKKGWHCINVLTKEVKKLERLTDQHSKDGHPTPFGDWIVIDSYPDLDRMQKLIAYNKKTEEIVWLGEFFHDMKHHDYNRCDLHPKFTVDGRKVYLDTIYKGKRELCSLEIKTN